MADPLTLNLAVLFTLAFLVAGTVKGSVGLGLPTTALAIMTLVIDPRAAIALVMIPMVVTNAWQVWRLGDILGCARRYLPFSLALMVSVGVTVALTRDAPDRLLFAMLGIGILFFVAVNSVIRVPVLPAWADRPAQIATGLICGVLGGMTSVWAPPMALYLAARRVPKDEFVRASGLLIFLGSLPLVIGFAAQNILTPRLAMVSAALLIPSLIGFSIGEVLRRKMSEAHFRAGLLIVFLIMGLNLLRRAIW